MRIVVIDNGGQWTHREWRVLRDLGADARILPNTQAPADLDADGYVLSGGALSLGGSETLGRVAEWIDGVTVPVLGICAGHHFLARHFGGTVARGAPEFGRVDLTLDLPEHPLVEGFPNPWPVWASHNDQVVRPPAQWRILAHSATCAVEAMAHPSRPFFGVQFHPEVEHTVRGTELFARFLRFCDPHRE
ncbi:MAG: GMP synthase subunit A [Thermoplasmata archaeon]